MHPPEGALQETDVGIVDAVVLKVKRVIAPSEVLLKAEFTILSAADTVEEAVEAVECAVKVVEVVANVVEDFNVLISPGQKKFGAM
jgi:hypothetical protein